MADANEQRRAQLHQRLAVSRAQLSALARALNGDAPEPDSGAEADGPRASFPRSRIMRALLGQPGRLLLGGVAATFTLLQPKLLRRVARLGPLLGPLLRPLFMRYLLPRLLGQR